jgi:hypothetical protein
VDRLNTAVNDRAQVRADQFDGQVPGLELGQTQQIIDDYREPVGAGGDRGQIRVLFGRGEGVDLVVEHRGGAGDHRQRATQFVGHEGEEFVLGAS